MSILDDIAEKIQSLLADEESMRQISELAAMFSGGEKGEPGAFPGQAGIPEFSPVPAILPRNRTDPTISE